MFTSRDQTQALFLSTSYLTKYVTVICRISYMHPLNIPQQTVIAIEINKLLEPGLFLHSLL